MNAAKRLGSRRGMLAGAVGVVLLLAGKPVRADLPLPHTASANVNAPLLRLTNTNGGASAWGFRGTGTYGFVGDSSVIGGAGARGTFFDAETGAARASGNLGRSVGGGTYYGVWGKLFSGSPGGAAVYGLSESTLGNAGFFEVRNSSSEVSAVYATTNGQTAAVHGESRGTGMAGLFSVGSPDSTARCLEARQYGQSDGVLSRHFGSIGTAGFFNITNSSNPSTALFAATAGTGLACYCAGQSLVGGDLDVTGGLTPSAAAFKIDHPLDPGNRYLQLPAVHSSEMRNIFNGVTVLDQNGEAVVELPEWFEAANRDFTYHLTPIGAPAPGLYVAQEVQDNAFLIAGGPAGLKVSWQVTGIRQDPYALLKPVAVEVDKPPHEVGRYRHPEAYGLPAAYRLEYEEHAAAYRADSADDEGRAEAVESDVPKGGLRDYLKRGATGSLPARALADKPPVAPTSDVLR